MILVEKVCKELGVEVGETWLGNDGYEYKITEDGLLGFYYMTSDGWAFDTDPALWSYLITGELKPVWKPKEGELYYVPSIKKLKNHRFHEGAWLNDDIDNWYMANNMIFKTKEEAIDCATNMIELAKHGI